MSAEGTAGFPAYRTEVFEEKTLLTHEFSPIDDAIVLAAGQNLKRGAVLGKVTGTGQWVLSLAAANDGSQTPKSILAFDVDATAEAKKAAAYVAGGRFITSQLVLGAGHTVASVKAAFDGKPLFFVDVLA